MNVKTSVGLLCVALAFFVSTEPSLAHYDLGYFTRDSSNTACGGGGRDLIDPINIAVFTTANNMADQAARHLDMDLTGSLAGKSQRLRNHSACDIQTAQRAKGVKQKHHIRVWGNADPDLKGRDISVGDAHFERKIQCGITDDSVYEYYNGRSGFDWAQQRWLHAMSDLYYGFFKRPRRGPFVQCDPNGEPRPDKPHWNGRQLAFKYDGGG